MLQFLILFGMVVFASAKATLQAGVSRRLLYSGQDSAFFHAQMFLLTALVMALLFWSFDFPLYGIWMAFGAGFFTVVYQISYAAALQTGAVALTVLFSNFNTLLVTLFCIVTYQERVYLTQLIGMIFLVVSMILISKKERKEAMPSCPRGRWILLALTAMLSCAGANIFMKIFSVSSTGDVAFGRSFVVLMYLIAAFFSLIWYLLNRKKHGKCSYGYRSVRAWSVSLLIAVLLGAYQLFYQRGLSSVPGSVLFPSFAGAQTLSMTVIGAVAFRDRLTRCQWWGMLCGILCVILMNLDLLPLW